MKLCSACLLGMRCRYDGKMKPDEKVIALSKREMLIPVCPEQLGGQPTPRPDAQIISGDGDAVLDGAARIREEDGTDVTGCFLKGAQEVLKIAQLYGVREAILKQRSPSCGCGQIYDGTFSKTVTKGDGVTTALLKKNGIAVLSEEEI